MAEQLQCKHKHKHVRRNNEGGCHETSHEIHEFRIHSRKLEKFYVNLTSIRSTVRKAAMFEV